MSHAKESASPLSLGQGPRLVRAKYVALLLIGVAATIYHLWFAYTYGIGMSKHLIVHLGIMMVVVVLVSFEPAGLVEGTVLTRLDNAVVLPLEGIAAIATSTYLWVSYERIAINQLGLYTDMDVLVGAIIILLVLDLSRRAFGLVLSMVGLVGLVYATYGTYFPGILHHQGVTLTRVITSSTVGFNGIYDIIVEVSATYIVAALNAR
jgi:TRAP-type uncharacterized transport system fused permease subunit